VTFDDGGLLWKKVEGSWVVEFPELAVYHAQQASIVSAKIKQPRDKNNPEIISS
jgi:hypothetical protein